MNSISLKKLLPAVAFLYLLVIGMTMPAREVYSCSAPLANDGSFDCANYKSTCTGPCVSEAYINSIVGTESGGCYNCPSDRWGESSALGRYQFIRGTRNSLCKKYKCLNCEGVSDAGFANCPALQDAVFQQFNRENWEIMRSCGAVGKKSDSCLLAAAHLRGPGTGTAASPGACGWINKGWDAPDANGTTMASYCAKHGGIEPAWGPCPEDAPAPATPENPTETNDTCKFGGGGGGGGGGEPPPAGGGEPPPDPSYPNPIPPVGMNGCVGCECSNQESDQTKKHIKEEHKETREHITKEFQHHQNWLFGANEYFNNKQRDGFWELHVQPALMMMTEQLVSVGMEQMLILGAFFDAKLQLETQLLFEEKTAQAHKDYQPSFDMCVVGTNMRSVAAADRNGEFTDFVMGQRAQDRQLGNYGGSSAYSADIDRKNRIEQVKERYCDLKDNRGELKTLCEKTAPKETVNRDVDYTRTLEQPRTLNIDFTDAKATADEQDVLALTSNLFSHDVLDKPSMTSLGAETAATSYMDMRGTFAKRSVAENSFNAIIGMKAAGTQESEKTIMFTQKILEQLGITDPDQRLILLGGTDDDGKTPKKRPSYYAQLEILSQKIYQDPQFFTNLYDKPANVRRRDVAMQAVNLMLERDMFKSELRNEMLYSVLLELELMKYQDDLQNRMNGMMEKYEEN